MFEQINDLLTPEVVAALITLLGSIITIIFADWRAKRAAKNEFKKLKMEWAREDRTLENQLFSDMNGAVSKYIQSGWPRHQRDALEKIAAFQSYCHQDYYASLADLQSAVLANDTAKTIAALAAVNQLRHDAVNGKRK